MKSMMGAVALTALIGAATVSIAQTTTRPTPPAGSRPAGPPAGARPAIAPTGTPPAFGGPHDPCRELNRPAPPAGATPPTTATTPPDHPTRADLVALLAKLGITCPASDDDSSAM